MKIDAPNELLLRVNRGYAKPEDSSETGSGATVDEAAGPGPAESRLVYMDTYGNTSYAY